jgi:dethiobiotin synthetase
MGRVVYIVGTDTGVGKTFLTSMLVAYLRSSGVSALAVKPFCTGGRRDVEILFKAQGCVLPREVINPFYFELPLSPLAAARMSGGALPDLTRVGRYIKGLREDSTIVLIEGCGGLCTPLGVSFALLEVIQAIPGPVILAARNALGVLNSTLLCVRLIQALIDVPIQIVLNDSPTRELSTDSNLKILSEIVEPIPVRRLPFAGRRIAVEIAQRKYKMLLADLVKEAIVPLP